jgi:hypothetical protein
MNLSAQCVCGSVEINTVGNPVLSAACHCPDCYEGSRRLEALSKSPPILDSFGGTAHLLFRKDRISYAKGKELLKSIKVDEDSPSRTYSSCCNSYLLLDVGPKMHVTPIFRGRFKGDVPNIEFRMNLKRKPGTENYPQDVPCFPSFPFRFIKKLIAAKFAMIFNK